MATLSSVFSRISGGAPSVSTSDAQKAISKAGGFGMLSLTGGMVKKGVEKAFAKADANGDSRVDVDEFKSAVRGAAAGKTLPDWSLIDPGGAGSLGRQELAELVKDAAKKKSSMGGMVDADGIARMVIAFVDDDGDGRVSKAEADALRADLG
jgi:hypothetical protein